MDIKSILNVFTDRKKKQNEEPVIINENTRNRILMLIREFFKERTLNSYSYGINSNSFEKFILEVKELFQFKLGLISLDDRYGNEFDETLSFIITCKGENFLDFLEYIFKTKQLDVVQEDVKNKLIDDINYVLQYGGIPFKLTKYIEEWIKEEGEKSRPYIGGPIFSNVLTRNIIAYPQVINKEEEFTFTETIEPALDILSDPRFNNANKEFLEALEHYKNKKYKECITSCCSSLESTIKIICKIKKWKYNPNSTLNPLILFVVDKGKMEKWYENVLVTPASIRNRLGSSHGKGENTSIANKNEAKFQINITATEIIFLFNELLKQ